jgi:hypothetical protein
LRGVSLRPILISCRHDCFTSIFRLAVRFPHSNHAP